MASSRKKQDEKNLKTLRELGALPQNKFCFECGQRGPTYINVTIGSFVCTKCSGMLRGLTPPHRVKSISMTTFTTEEILFLKHRGNDYCRRIWLGLYDGTPPNAADEQSIRDFMVDKYERRRYYLECVEQPSSEVPSIKTQLLVESKKPPKANGQQQHANHVSNGTTAMHSNGTTTTMHRNRPEVKSNTNNTNSSNNSFVADFDKADIFSATNLTNGNNNNNNSLQNGFANFDNHPEFSNSGFGSNKMNGMPPTSSLNGWTAHQNHINGNNITNAPPPIEDKYAALKDLDNEMKSQHNQQQQQQQQQQQDWSSSGSLYSSSTPSGSVYSSPSPQGSIFGSPSQGQLGTAYCPTQENTNQIFNPFGTNGVNWAGGNGFNTNGLLQQNPNFVNPFKESQTKLNGVNGFSNGVFQPMFASTAPTMPSNGMTNGWDVNPFKGSNVLSANPNNPFL